MKKLKHIYLIFPFLFLCFFPRSSVAITSDDSGSLKKQTFEIKNSVTILSDFEDVDAYQNKIRFNQREFIPVLVTNNLVLCSVFFSETSSSSSFISAAKKRAFIGVFRL